jgi:hypothetical protein
MLLRTSMVLWITTKQLLLSDALRLPTGNMYTRWVPQCIITDVKMYTYRPRPVNASWILSSYFPTIIKCHRSSTKSHSLALGMTPYRPLLTWQQFSNSNCNKPNLPRLKLYLQRSSNAHALLNLQIKSLTLPCPYRDTRDHKQ